MTGNGVLPIGTITVDARFNGPPDSANGGVTCGLIAQRMGGVVEVTLRAPPPLEMPLSIYRSAGGLTVRDGDTLIAEATAGVFDLDIPEAPDVATARRAMERFPGAESHFFPTCFVCGTERGHGDGLRIHPGPIDDGVENVAAVWKPADAHCRDGMATDEAVWGALDCPSAWTWRGEAGAPIVLGRLVAERHAPILQGEEVVVLAWPVALDGRKFTAGTALFGNDGTLRAASKATWIKVRT